MKVRSLVSHWLFVPECDFVDSLGLAIVLSLIKRTNLVISCAFYAYGTPGGRPETGAASEESHSQPCYRCSGVGAWRRKPAPKECSWVGAWHPGLRVSSGQAQLPCSGMRAWCPTGTQRTCSWAGAWRLGLKARGGLSHACSGIGAWCPARAQQACSWAGA